MNGTRMDEIKLVRGFFLYAFSVSSMRCCAVSTFLRMNATTP